MEPSELLNQYPTIDDAERTLDNLLKEDKAERKDSNSLAAASASCYSSTPTGGDEAAGTSPS